MNPSECFSKSVHLSNERISYYINNSWNVIVNVVLDTQLEKKKAIKETISS